MLTKEDLCKGTKQIKKLTLPIGEVFVSPLDPVEMIAWFYGDKDQLKKMIEAANSEKGELPDSRLIMVMAAACLCDEKGTRLFQPKDDISNFMADDPPSLYILLHEVAGYFPKLDEKKTA